MLLLELDLLIAERHVQVLLEYVYALVNGIGQTDECVEVVGQVAVAEELLALLVEELLDVVALHLWLPRQCGARRLVHAQ